MIYTIDSTGKILETLDFFKLTNQKSLIPYFENSSKSIDIESIIIDFSYKDTLDRFNKFTDKLEYRNVIREERKASPMFAKLNKSEDNNNTVVFSDITPNYIFKTTNRNKKDTYSTYNFSLLCDKIVICGEFYTNNLFILDRNTMKVTRNIIVESDYTNTDIEYFSFYNEKTAQENLISFNYEYANSIMQVCYDKYRDNYLVVLAHYVDFKKNHERKKYNRPFSIITYDKDFNKLGEQVFDNRKYDFYVPIYITV